MYFWKFSTVLIIVFLCILRNNYTKAAVPLLSLFSKHRSNSLNKLCMKRWHCIFNTIVKEIDLERHFIFHSCIYLRNFRCCFWYNLCVPVVSESVPPRPIKYIYLSCKLLVPDIFQQIIFKLWHLVPLPSVHWRDSQDSLTNTIGSQQHFSSHQYN